MQADEVVRAQRNELERVKLDIMNDNIRHVQQILSLKGDVVEAITETLNSVVSVLEDVECQLLEGVDRKQFSPLQQQLLTLYDGVKAKIGMMRQLAEADIDDADILCVPDAKEAIGRTDEDGEPEHQVIPSPAEEIAPDRQRMLEDLGNEVDLSRYRPSVHTNWGDDGLRADVEKVFVVLPFAEPGKRDGMSLSKIAKASKTPRSTVVDWWHQIRENPLWRPWHNNLNGGPEKRRQRFAIRKAARKVLLQKVAAKEIITETAAEQVIHACARELGWSGKPLCQTTIRSWLGKMGFSLRLLHYKRRPSSTSPERKEAFVKDITTCSSENPTLTISFDETAVRTSQDTMRGYVERGSHDVQFQGQTGEREQFTMMLGMSAAGQFTVPIAIAKGKTARCHGQVDVDGVIVVHSQSGWINSDICVWMMENMRQIVPWWDGVKPLDVFWDCYRAHGRDCVKDAARKSNIRLHVVPAGCTDELQPLDRAVFGEVKSRFRKRYRRWLVETGGRLTKALAATWLVDSMNRTSQASRAKAWNYDAWLTPAPAPAIVFDAVYREGVAVDD